MQNTAPTNRLLSLDFMRGFIMVLLMMESTGLYAHLNEYAQDSSWHFLTIQLEHHPWHGLRFWDLVQPGFMLMAGTALSLSLYNNMAYPRSSLLKKHYAAVAGCFSGEYWIMR